ncbi:MAG: S1 RNA-binding domain-containing protein [Chloroflexota bacterium]
MPLEVGAVVEGVVTGITHFGAFIELPGGKTGLVHISEVADAYVKDIHDYLKEQDHVKVKVLSLDTNGRIGLSIRQANPRVRRQTQAQFEDKLARFIRDSEERNADVRRNQDSKRGGRGTRFF